MKSHLNLLGSLLCLASLTACGPSFERIDVTAASQNELPSSISVRRVSLVVGGIAKANMRGVNSKDQDMRVEVESDDPTILTVSRCCASKGFVFVGVRPGETHVIYRADGEIVAVADAVVSEQAPLP